MKNQIIILSIMLASVFALQSQTLYFQDKFDTYEAGTPLTVANSADWFTWSGGHGTAQDPLVSAAYSSSAPNALHISETSDVIYKFKNQTTGHYLIEMDVFIPTGSLGAYFNVQHYANPGKEWAFDCYFNGIGNGQLIVANVKYNFNVPGGWFHIKIDVNLDEDLCTLTVADHAIHTWAFHNQSTSTVPGINQLGSVNFYAGYLDGTGNGGNYFVDNFTVWELKAAQQGIFVIEPETPIVLNVHTLENKTLKLSNQGDAPIDYELVPVYQISEVNHTSTGSQLITHCATTGTHGVGYGTATQIGAASGYSPEMLQEHIGKTVRTFEIGLLGVSGILEANLCIWDMAPLRMTGVGTLLYEQPIPVSDLISGLNSITLNEPWLIDGRYLCIGVRLTVIPSVVGISLDDTPVAQCNPLGRLRQNNSNWSLLADTYSGSGEPLNGVWIMNIYIDGTPVKPWITPDHTSHILQPNQHKDLMLTFTPEDMMENEVKNAQLYFYSNDFDKEKTIIDITVGFTDDIETFTLNGVETKWYPNPASNWVTVACNSMIKSISILNAMGQTVFTTHVNAESVILDSSTLSAGIYFVKVDTDKGVHGGKLVIIK
jgi:hypothetical protein